MEFREVLRRRHMIRSYQENRPVPTDAVEAILRAALRAPSAGFTQGVSLLVLGPAAERETFWQVVADTDTTWLRGMRTAPVLVLVWTSEEAYLDRYAEPDKGWTDRDEARWPVPYWWVDAGMAALLVLQTAVDEGLGACFFGIEARHLDGFREAFGIPDDHAPVGAITVGHRETDTGVPGSPARRERRGNVVHHGRWGTTVTP